MKNVTPWSNKDISFVKNNYEKMNVLKLSVALNKNRSSVANKIHALGLITPFRGNRLRTKVDFLLENGLETFYWMGFLLADGCFRKSNKKNKHNVINEISVMLSIKDIKHLEKLSEKLCSHVEIVLNQGFTLAYKIRIDVSDYHKVPLICEKFNIKERKTYNPPNFSKYNFTNEQILSLIVGFIDGDGSISSNGNNGFDIKIEIHKSWKENLEFINNFIHTIYNMPQDSHIRERRNMETLAISKQQLVGFIKYFILENNLPVLTRKWGKIKAMNPKTTPLPRHYRRRVRINGVEYPSISEAAKNIGYSVANLAKIVKGNKRDLTNIFKKI